MRDCQAEFGEHEHDDTHTAERCAEIIRGMNEDAYEMGADFPDIGDEYYSGTGELVGDDSYIDYLNGGH